MTANKTLFNFYAFVLIFTPMLFVTNTGELFEFPKTFFIYFAAVFFLLIYGVETILKYKPFTKPSLPVLFYIFVFILTTLTSSHLYTSIFGYYTRFNDGLLSVLAFFVIYFVSKNKLYPTDLSRLSNILLLPVVPISLFGISQHFGFFAGTLWFGDKVARVYSSFGQPNWLAQYLVMLLPVIFFKIFDGIVERFWLLVFALGYLCLVFTYSLSGFAGLGLAIFVSCLLLIKKLGFTKVRLKIGFLFLYMIFMPLIFPGILKERIHDFGQDVFGVLVSPVRAQADVTQVAPSKYQISDAGFIRRYAWLGTWRLITSEPKTFFLGTGPETFPYSFQPYRPRELNYSSEWAFLFNKPHNYYLELWAESGLLGFIAYGVLFFYVSYKQAMPQRMGLLAFAVTNVFGWPVVGTAMIFWFWLLDAEGVPNV